MLDEVYVRLRASQPLAGQAAFARTVPSIDDSALYEIHRWLSQEPRTQASRPACAAAGVVLSIPPRDHAGGVSALPAPYGAVFILSRGHRS